jgi:predicted CDP-diglyceride synthetase/phosphatidate cytidylyltransferase
MRHDQLSKTLIATFFTDFLRLTLPESALRLRLDEAIFVDKELYTDWPSGRRRELDLLVRVPVEDEEMVLLVHVEIERTARAGMDQRLWRYYMQIRLRHDLLVLPILATIGGDTTRYLERTAKVQWGLMICVFCISHVPALLNLEIPGYAGRNLLLFAFLVIVVQSSDVLQYVWGKLIGKHLIAPKLSPSKTVEGFVGGILSASLLGAALWWITPFSPLQAFALALVANLMGFFGGLVMSAIKRDRGIKDWGHMIEGHGGVLDRLDSVCFAAPVFFHLIRYGWV